MYASYLIVTSLAAAANIYAATNELTRPEWLLANMERMGVRERSLPTLAALKLLGAVGLVAGIWIPVVGIAAAAGLVLYFAGAIVTALHVRWYAHLPYPLVWLLLAVGALVLRVHPA